MTLQLSQIDVQAKPKESRVTNSTHSQTHMHAKLQTDRNPNQVMF